MKNHPCRDCITAAVCKQKTFDFLTMDCKPIYSFIFGNYDILNYNRKEHVKSVRERVKETFIELYPNTWKPATNGSTWTWSTKIVKR